MMPDPGALDDQIVHSLTPAAAKAPAAPSWARRIPKRTYVLAGIAGVAFILMWIFEGTARTAPADADPNAFLAPWRYAAAGTVMLWTTIITGSASLWTWLLHVRDREYIVRSLAYRAQLAKQSSQHGKG